MQQEQLHAKVMGRVQGVGFRFFVIETAQQLGLTGWVRNRWDESVEVLAEGEHDKLEQLLFALRRGPSLAHVTQVQYEWGEASGAYNRFQALPTE